MMITETAAFEVQRRLLCDPPAISGLDIAVSWKPYGEVGGDFYDFAMLEEDGVGITLGDVSGKGYDAALLMVYALAEVRSRLSENQRLPYLMSRLDESLKDYSSSNKFAEVLVGIYSMSTRHFSFVQGGGIFPIAFHCNTEDCVLYQNVNYRVPGLAIPKGLGLRYAENTVELERGDVLILFTDGIGERLDRDGKEVIRADDFGSRIAPSIKRVCKENVDRGALELKDIFVEYFDSLESARTDDETIIVLKVK